MSVIQVERGHDKIQKEASFLIIKYFNDTFSDRMTQALFIK